MISSRFYSMFFYIQITIVALGVCALLAARAAGTLIADHLRAESQEWEVLNPPELAEELQQLHDISSITCNMFSSTCKSGGVTDTADVLHDQQTWNPENLTLVATLTCSRDARWSFAASTTCK